jgi:hypothetical protein
MSPEWGRYDQAKADADIAVHAALTTGVHGVGAGTLVGTTLTQTLTNKTLTSPTIQGTVLAGTGLTMPAFTAGGDITLGANKAKWTTSMIKDLGSYTLGVRNLADNGYCYLSCQGLNFNEMLSVLADALSFRGPQLTGGYFTFLAQDTGVGLIEVMRLVGAADPYMSFGGSQQHKFTNAGLIFFTGLPTSDPAVAGQLYTAAGVLMVSAG